MVTYHTIVDQIDGVSGYCDCGAVVVAYCEGFGPQTHFVYLDNRGSETCE